MTKSPLEQLLEAGQDLIGQIEDAKESLRVDITNLTEAASGIDSAVDELSAQADDLQRRITAVEQETPNDPVAIATIEAIDNLLALLLQAKTHLEADERLAALGTLGSFDHHADDLKAAIRLTVMSVRRQK